MPRVGKHSESCDVIILMSQPPKSKKGSCAYSEVKGAVADPRRAHPARP